FVEDEAGVFEEGGEFGAVEGLGVVHDEDGDLGAAEQVEGAGVEVAGVHDGGLVAEAGGGLFDLFEADGHLHEAGGQELVVGHVVDGGEVEVEGEAGEGDAGVVESVGDGHGGGVLHEEHVGAHLVHGAGGVNGGEAAVGLFVEIDDGFIDGGVVGEGPAEGAGPAGGVGLHELGLDHVGGGFAAVHVGEEGGVAVFAGFAVEDGDGRGAVGQGGGEHGVVEGGGDVAGEPGGV